MNALKRLILTLSAQFSNIVEDFENHEAVASAAIKKVETAVARTNVQLSRVTRELSSIDQKLAELSQDADCWADRAVQVQPLDEHRALECVRRLQSTRREMSHLERHRQELLTLKLKLAEHLEQITMQLNELKHRKELLAARQNKADAMHALDIVCRDPSSSIEEVFDRWETQIASREYSVSGSTTMDVFTAEFEKEEEEQALRSALEELLRKVGHDRSEEGQGHE